MSFSKSSSFFETSFKDAIIRSAALHLGLITIAVGVHFLVEHVRSRELTNVPIEVFENPVVAASPQALNLDPPQPVPPPPAVPANQVFGLSRKAITASASDASAIEAKAGNTVAKEMDDIQLKDTDPDSLPIPADEVLVTSMPVLLQDSKVPFPETAKKQNVTGNVVLNLLIDDQGRVRQVEVLQGPGFGLDEAAVSAARQFLFRPAKMGDKSVAVRIRYTYRFVLTN